AFLCMASQRFGAQIILRLTAAILPISMFWKKSIAPIVLMRTASLHTSAKSPDAPSNTGARSSMPGALLALTHSIRLFTTTATRAPLEEGRMKAPRRNRHPIDLHKTTGHSYDSGPLLAATACTSGARAGEAKPGDLVTTAE